MKLFLSRSLSEWLARLPAGQEVESSILGVKIKEVFFGFNNNETNTIYIVNLS